MDFAGLWTPGLTHYQVVQTGPRSLHVRIVTRKDSVKRDIMELMIELLKEAGFPEHSVEITVQSVPEIPPDPKTGKTPMIIPYSN